MKLIPETETQDEIDRRTFVLCCAIIAIEKLRDDALGRDQHEVAGIFDRRVVVLKTMLLEYESLLD